MSAYNDRIYSTLSGRHCALYNADSSVKLNELYQRDIAPKTYQERREQQISVLINHLVSLSKELHR